MTEAPKKSKSYAAKRAQCVFEKVENIVNIKGLDYVAFTTLTFADRPSAEEAQKRLNSLITNFFRSIGGGEFHGVSVVEFQERGAIHFHLVWVTPWDIRTGFNFELQKQAYHIHREEGWRAAKFFSEQNDWFNAPPQLRRFWTLLRRTAKRYGFSRCETYPVRTTVKAAARYVGSYISKTSNSPHYTPGMKLLRSYGPIARLSTVKRSWAGLADRSTPHPSRPGECVVLYGEGPGPQWRRGCAELSKLLNLPTFSPVLGPRWSHEFGKLINWLGHLSDKYLVSSSDKSLLSELHQVLQSTPHTFDQRLKRVRLLDDYRESLDSMIPLLKFSDRPLQVHLRIKDEILEPFPNWLPEPDFAFVSSRRSQSSSLDVLGLLRAFELADRRDSLRDSATDISGAQNESSDSHPQSFPLPNH